MPVTIIPQPDPDANGLPCEGEDNDPCTVGQCLNGACIPTSGNGNDFIPCTPDTNECTLDYCFNAQCIHPDSEGGEPCEDDDGNDCTVGECQSGVCVPLCGQDCAVCTTTSGHSGSCEDCSCKRTECDLTLGWGSGYPCEVVANNVHVDCWPDCGIVSLEFSADYPPGNEAKEPWLHFESLPWVACSKGAMNLPVYVTVADDAPPGAVPISVTGTTSTGESCQSHGLFTVQQFGVAEVIDQDDPTNATWMELSSGPVYGGSEASTADNLRLIVTPPGGPVTNIQWSVSGTGMADWSPPPAGPAATVWDLGDLLNPSAGPVEFRADVSYADGAHRCRVFESEMGIRTDDVIVIGWIDPVGVTLPPGAAGWLATMMPAAGPPVPSSLECNLFMLDLSENFTTPNFHTLTALDRDYILAWLFKFAGNTNPSLVIPGGDFRDPTDKFLVEAEVEEFFSDKTNFKLFNRLQVRFRAGSDGFIGLPTLLQDEADTGDTVNPCGPLAGFWSVIEGQVGHVNHSGILAGPNTRIVSINDGSPDIGAIRAFNTLMGKDLPVAQTPLFWENIGSKITFDYAGPLDGAVVVQPYPTYFVYVNGSLRDVVPQAATPQAHFYMFPYPFGTVGCLGVGGLTPGGRCGDAESPSDATSRIPPSGYTLP